MYKNRYSIDGLIVKGINQYFSFHRQFLGLVQVGNWIQDPGTVAHLKRFGVWIRVVPPQPVFQDIPEPHLLCGLQAQCRVSVEEQVVLESSK